MNRKVVFLSINTIWFWSAICLAGTYGGGSGTPEDPYQIWTAEQLNEFGKTTEDYDKAVILMDDIDLSDYSYTTALIAPDIDIKEYGPQGPAFSGTFDGNNYTISHFRSHNSEGHYVAFIGYIKRNGCVKNLKLKDVSIEGNISIGLMSGLNEGKILNCSTQGIIKGSLGVSGLIGFNDGGLIDHCKTQCVIIPNRRGQRIGGLAGGNNQGQITNSLALCTISLTNCFGYIGILSGDNVHGSIERCWASGTILSDERLINIGGLCGYNNGEILECAVYNTSLKVPQAENIGGLTGQNESTISRCYSEGFVRGNQNCGGLVGLNQGYIADSYTITRVAGEFFTGGFLGTNRTGIARSYSIGQVAAVQKKAGGFVGQNQGVVYISFWDTQRSGLLYSDGGIGKTTAELMQTQTFLGWGDDVWVLNLGQDYPRLIWQQSSGEIIQDHPAVYGGGSGTPENPYLVSTANHLLEIGQYPQDLNKCYQLTNDIDLGSISSFPGIGNGLGFSGTFDGSGHVIKNLNIHQTGFYTGLFPLVFMKGIIKNLTVENAAVSGQSNLGILSGKCDGLIENCSVSGTINAQAMSPQQNFGGIAALNFGTIRRTSVHATLTITIGGMRNAGVCVAQNGGHIEECAAYGQIKICGPDSAQFGGFAGFGIYDSHISDCLSEVDVISLGKKCFNFGGFTGGQCYRTRMERCLSVGKMENGPENHDFGGFAAINGDKNITNGKIQNCFWDIQTSGQHVGIAQNFTPNNAPTGLTTHELTTLATYTQATWDIDSDKTKVWTITEGNYPSLTCFINSDK